MRLYSPNDLEKLFGNSGEGPDRSSASRQEGVKGAIYLDLPHQGLTIQEPQAIFQTVSEVEFSEVKDV